MVLLVPLAIFLVLSVMLIVLLAKTKPPTAQDTVEAFCDAALNNDSVTQEVLTASIELSMQAKKAIENLRANHGEIAKSWNTKILKTWDDSESSYELVEVPLLASEQSLKFKCQFVVNQWTITTIQLSSSKSNLVL